MDSELLLSAAVGNDDDELLLFSLLCQDQDKEKCRLDLESLSNEDCIFLFRFDKTDIIRLKEALQIPPIVKGINRTICSGNEALCILLCRLSYPNRLEDLSALFGRSPLEISIIFNQLLDDLHDRYCALLQNFDQPWLDNNHLREYANAVQNKGAPLPNCWGFIDGTTRPICRPSFGQKEAFSGHKRCHCLKYQSVILPNGIVANLSGPWEGKRHDASILTESGLLAQLETKYTNEGEPFCIYGDQAYPLKPHLICPYKGALLTPDQQDFNTQMSMSRMCVEWGFNKVVRTFAFLDYKANQRCFLQPVVKYYIVGTLLTNCHTCLYGSQVSSYFNIYPPTLEQYLNN